MKIYFYWFDGFVLMSRRPSLGSGNDGRSASTELSRKDLMTNAASAMRNIGYTQNFES